MGNIILEKFRLYVPDIETAKKIFTDALGLELLKEKTSDNKAGSISFKLGEHTKLFCLKRNASDKKLEAYTNSINLFANKTDIEKAYNALKNTNLDLKLNETEAEGKKYLILHIATQTPTTFVNVSELEM